MISFFGKVSLWKAADLSPLGSVAIGNNPMGICSDDANSWITYSNLGERGPARPVLSS